MAENTLSIREKIGYGMGDAGCNIIFGAIMLFVNYFTLIYSDWRRRWSAYFCSRCESSMR